METYALDNDVVPSTFYRERPARGRGIRTRLLPTDNEIVFERSERFCKRDEPPQTFNRLRVSFGPVFRLRISDISTLQDV